MKPNYGIFLRLAPVAALVLLGLATGCNTVTPSGRDDASYELRGAAVKRLNLDDLAVQILINRDDEVLQGAAVLFSGDSLVFDTMFYSRDYASADSIAPGAHSVLMDDDGNYADTVLAVMPGDLIDSTTGLPENRVNPGGDVVTVNFTGSVGADGYILAVVLQDSLTTGFGFSEWVGTGATSVTVPREAFRMSGAQEPDTGWYYVYVYAYADAPDSAVASGLLPVPLPSALTDNIANDRFSGTFGSIVVPLPDSIHVVAR